VFLIHCVPIHSIPMHSVPLHGLTARSQRPIGPQVRQSRGCTQSSPCFGIRRSRTRVGRGPKKKSTGDDLRSLADRGGDAHAP